LHRVRRVHRLHLRRRRHPRRRGRDDWNLIYEALQGAGAHFVAFASFLKCVLVTKSFVRYFGSETKVVTTSHSSTLGAGKRSKYSVTLVLSLYGTPFFRSHPPLSIVVVTLRLP